MRPWQLTSETLPVIGELVEVGNGIAVMNAWREIKREDRYTRAWMWRLSGPGPAVYVAPSSYPQWRSID